MTLRSLAILFTAEDPRLSVRYTARDGPSPGTKARRREVQELARRAHRATFAALVAAHEQEVSRCRVALGLETEERKSA